MAELPTCSLLIVKKEEVEAARKEFGVDDVTSFMESLDDIKEWCEKEQHLADSVKHLSIPLLEKLHALARGSIEGTKQKIEKLFTTRGLMPELVLNRTPEEFDSLLECVNYVPLPKLTPGEQCRVMVSQILKENPDELSLLKYVRYQFLVGEYRIKYDYCLGERYIVDMKNSSVGLLAKFNPVVMNKASILAIDGYGTRVKGIHIINAPSFVDKFVFLLKQSLREKVASRLHIHNSYEDLQKHIPKEVLPKEYGGDEESCSDLTAKWKEELRSKEARDFLASLDHLVSDESKRLASSKFAEDYMGMPGSFKRLNVD